MIPLRQSKWAKVVFPTPPAKVGPDRTHQRMGGQAALFGSALHLQVYHHQVQRDLKAILSWKPSSFSRGKLRPSSPSCPQVELDLNSSARSYTENVEQSQTMGSPMDPWVLPTEIRGGHWLAAGHTNQGRSWCFLHRIWMVAVDPPVDRWQTSHIQYPLLN